MIKWHRIKFDPNLSKSESPDSALPAPDSTCDLAFGSVFILLPASKDLTQVGVENKIIPGLLLKLQFISKP